MKINILTFQFAKNYGAILQAHALSSYIKNNLHEECKIIQYWPDRSEASWKMYYRVSSNPQLSPSMSFLRVHVLSLLNYHIN